MDSILNPLYIAVSWVIVTIHKALTPIFGTDSGVSWSLAIIGLVIIIRIILIPLFVKQIKSQRALTALQPHMKEIQKKYKDDRQKQSEEMMKLYKEHKTNPLASCFPILAQAPIFFALFTVLNGIGKVPIDTKGVLTKEDGISAAQAEFFGAPISQTFLGSDIGTVKLVTIFLIAFMSLTTFTTQRQLMTKGMPKMDSSNNMMLQQQKIMLYAFPIIFAITGVNFPVGVLIYWSTTNLWTWGQQYYVIKRNPTPGSPAYEELQRKRNAAQAEFFGAPISQTFLGSDSGTVKLVTIFLIAFMSLTTFTTQRQLMTKGMPKMDSSNNMMLQQQKIMLYAFPIIFAITGVNFPVGVLIYWSTTNLWTWGQQYYVIKRNPTPGSPAYEELQRKRNKKSGVVETEEPETSEGTTMEKGQRQQPKKKKKKK